MVEMTMSFSKGNKNETSISHNNRSLDPNFNFEKMGHKHIKRDYTHLNEVLIHDDIKRVYQEEFGEAVKKYNDKQKRKDRKIKDYYQKVKHDKTLHTQYEFIVQVGNKGDFEDGDRTASRQWQAGKKMLEDYYYGFRKRNPNLRVYNAVIHMDEEGAPHMHMNVVPIARGYSRGVSVRPAFNKALEQEGFEPSKQDSRKQFKDFQHREADALADVAKQFHISRKQGITNKLKDVHEYKKAIREVDQLRDHELGLVEQQISEKNQKLASLDHQIVKKSEAVNLIDKQLAAAKRQAQVNLDNWVKEEQEKEKKRLEQAKKRDDQLLAERRQRQLERTKQLGHAYDDVQPSDEEAKSLIKTNVLGRVDWEQTTPRLKTLIRAAKLGEKVDRAVNDQEEEVNRRVAKKTKPLREELKRYKDLNSMRFEEIQNLKLEIRRLHGFIENTLNTVREKVSDTKDFFKRLGQKMSFSNKNAMYDLRKEEKDAVKQGYDEADRQTEQEVERYQHYFGQDLDR